MPEMLDWCSKFFRIQYDVPRRLDRGLSENLPYLEHHQRRYGS
jgi:hypothetical protein